MAKWFVAAKKADFERIGRQYGLDPVIARLIRNRDVTEPAEIERFLHGTPDDIPSPFLLRDMEQAAALLREAIRRGERIRIIGDYDIDGVCAAQILRRGLRELGADVDAVLPHRVQDGYGLSERRIREAAQDGVRWIVTCDNGIAAAEEIALAGELGISVVVTDHHEVPRREGASGREDLLPPAAAVVDPKRSDCSYPFAGICGAAVAYKLVQALLIQEGIERPEMMAELFELAAFATVGDVMELREENRILVKYGLEQMRHSRNAGLRALMEVCGVEGGTLNAYHIGFVLGPCMNATGRLDTAERALALLDERDGAEALRLAGELKSLNESRKAMTQKQVDAACAMVERQARLDDVLVLYLPQCHESLAGIVAGRVREKYNHPVFILTRGAEGVKGSGRSIERFDMYAQMSRCKELFTRYGGHRMAAGLSMEEGNVEPFRRRINEDTGLTEDDFEEKIHIDAAMPLSYVTRRLTEQLSVLEPFGNGNRKPLFADRSLLFMSGRVLGKKNNAARFRVSDPAGRRYELLYFGDLTDFFAFIRQRFGAEAAKRLGAQPGEGAEDGVLSESGSRMDGSDGRLAENGSRLEGNVGCPEGNGGALAENGSRPEESGCRADGAAQARPVRLHVTYYPTLNTFRGKVNLELVMQHYCEASP